LGSTTVTADVYGGNVQRQLYKGWGETRSTSTVGTDYAYTGQYAYDDSSTEFGLLFYRSRFYDSSLGRFVSADTVIPEANQGVQAWDRYAGMNNNPVRWNDPSGHDVGNAGHDGWKTVCQVPMTCEQEPVDYEPSPVNHNYTSETNSDLLDGGPGSVGGAQAAEEGYTGYSNSGESTNPAVAGALALPAFANDMLVLFRDSVRTGNEISGRVYWDLNPNGFKLTGVSITNSGYEDVAISNASVTEYSVFDNSLVNYEVLYSINQTLYTPPNYGVASPGSSPALVTVSYENVPNYHYLNISIGVISVSGRTGSVGLSLYVNPPLP
jgi:RHS repeat-associated protein